MHAEVEKCWTWYFSVLSVLKQRAHGDPSVNYGHGGLWDSAPKITAGEGKQQFRSQS
jgi:hypothetical protein